MKTMLLALASLTIGLVPTASVVANGSEPTTAVENGIHHHYYVHYRTCLHDPCRIAGPFHSRYAAEAQARHLAFHGYIIDGIVCQ